MKILLTGGLGFNGSHTATVLGQEHDIVIVDNASNSSEMVMERLQTILARPIRYFHIDLSDQAELSALFAEEQFDAVFHLA
jgi:UDP-glucose 4-epimerase